MEVVFEALVVPADRHRTGRVWCVVRAGELLVRSDGSGLLGLVAEEVALGVLADYPADASGEPTAGRDASREHFLGEFSGAPVWAIDVPETRDAPTGFAFVGLRQLPVLGANDDVWTVGARAVQIVEWARTHRYCGACGHATEPMTTERAMKCPSCGLLAYPRLSPAVIMLVRRGAEALLAHGRMAPRVFYGPLSGFVEPGETLEHAVRREVREEVGVDVGALHYFGSQPWPFPNSLMVGFIAEYESGEIVIDPAEIVDARWFRRDEIPAIPAPFAIGARLLEAFREGAV